MLKEKKLERDDDGALMLPTEVCGVPDIPVPGETGCSLQVPGPFPVSHTAVAGDDWHGEPAVFLGRREPQEVSSKRNDI